MNNEDKRFKQINRIATPIKVDEFGNKVEEAPQTTNKPSIKPSVERPKKRIDQELIVKFLIGVFVIGILITSVYLIIPESMASIKITYNDITTVTTYPSLKNYSFEEHILSENEFLDENYEYQVNEFIIRKTNNIIYVNNIKITDGESIRSTVGTIDDLLIFTSESNDIRTKTLYIVDKSGNIIKELYHIGNIDGMVIMSDSASVNYSSESLVIKASNVLNNFIIPNNTKDNINQVSICDEDKLFENSIETEKPVVVYYSIFYKGNHEFSEPISIYEESIEEYKANNNYCN